MNYSKPIMLILVAFGFFSLVMNFNTPVRDSERSPSSVVEISHPWWMTH